MVGPFMDKYGRRPALIITNIFSIIGWLLLSVHTFRPPIAQLIIGRIFTGIATGVNSIPPAIYAAECLGTTNLNLRSSFVTWSTVALSAGIFLVYAMGASMPYFAVASIATLISILALILVAIFLPESPVWLTSKGRIGDAECSMKDLNIPPPIQETPPSQETGETPQVQTQTPKDSWSYKELLKPEVYKPLMIMSGFFFFQNFSGVYVVIAYMVDVVRTAGVNTLSPYTVTVIGGAIILTVALAASLIYPKTGVRVIAVISGVGITSTMWFIGLLLILKPYWNSVTVLDFLNWLPFFIVLVNIALSSVGFLILPWSMLGEVFPIQVKGFAAGIAGSLGFIFSFISLKLYPYIRIGFGASGLFFFFGTMAFFGTIFVILFLPETRGKTLQEILDGFKRRV
jgi:MFS family permease